MIGKYDKAVLEFSGGKDSTALLYMCRPYLDKIEVYHADAGANFPHMNEFIHKTCEKLGARLTIISPPEPILKSLEEHGMPSDILPFENMEFFQFSLPDEKKQKLQLTLQCCGYNRFKPMHDAVIKSGIKLILRGSKGTDKRISAKDGYVDETGIEIRSPLWNWTDKDTYDYLKKENIELPSHYRKVPDSLDCWLCTGYLGPQWHGIERLKYIKSEHPEYWGMLRKRLVTVHDALREEVSSIAPAFKICEKEKANARS
jgi:3'-phosphoadenosine 5'-phosphosulfate sulfotransferase (PAPS reductase)/FAD synthetase